MSRSPYSGLPQRAFWRGGVAGAGPFPPDIYQPRHKLTKETRVFTAGSCFAQHVGAAMKTASIAVIDTEPARRGMPPETARRYGYGTYAARFGNIYTLRQFRQLIEEMTGQFTPALPVWEKGGRHWDALRPGVEPEGLASSALVAEMRAHHLQRLATAVERADMVVFTLGLTEAWEHAETGTVYPTAPGTIAGDFDPDMFRFVNFDVADMLEDFGTLDTTLRQINPDFTWLLTVSPVPLAATATGEHVLSATVRSKSTLRVVCDMLCRAYDKVDYFPSYEMVTSPAHATSPFEADLRSVKREVVQGIMQSFLAAHGLGKAATNTTPETVDAQGDAVCEDLLLEAFRP
jgi:hypothetical protein